RDGARDDEDGSFHTALSPVSLQPVAEDDQAIALVVNVTKKFFERSLQRVVHGLVDSRNLGPALRKQHVVRRDEMRRVHAEQGYALHFSEPEPELDEQRAGLCENNVEIPPVDIEDPRGKRKRKVDARVRAERDARELDRPWSELVDRGIRVVGA